MSTVDIIADRRSAWTFRGDIEEVSLCMWVMCDDLVRMIIERVEVGV